MKNLVNTDYMTLEQFLDSVQGDLKKYRDSGVIDISGLYKVVSYCNQSAGIRVSPIVCEVLDIENYKAPIPNGFKKLKSIDIVYKTYRRSQDHSYTNWTKTVNQQPHQSIPTFTPMGCRTQCNDCYWQIPYRPVQEQVLIFNEYYTLQHSNNKPQRSEYLIDTDEQAFIFGIQEGRAIVTYYADLDTLGLIPKNRKLADFYEWSIKEKILQDALMNSDDDVANKLQYAERQKFLAYTDFSSYILSSSYKQDREMNKRYEEEFEQQWVNNIR